MSNRYFEKKQCITLIFVLLNALAFLIISSMSSPLYPMNPWVDVNAYFTVGRGILSGKAPYLDLFDVKGPLIFYIYSVMGLISSNTYNGVFVVEVLLFIAFLFVSYKTIALYTNNSLIQMILTAYVAFSTVTSYAFEKGTSVEELCLWGMSCALYIVLKRLKSDSDISFKDALLIGVLAAWCFWIKYTMFGLFLGLAVFVVFKYLFNDIRRFLKLLGGFLLGFSLFSFLIIVALIMQGALSDAINSYFFANISQYSQVTGGSKIIAIVVSIIKGALSFTLRNPLYSVVIWAGLIVSLINKKKWDIVLLWISFVALMVFDYGGGVRNRYYALVFAAFIPICMGQIIVLIQKCDLLEKMPFLCNEETGKCLCTGIIVAILMILSYFISDNTELLKYDKEEMPQYRFASEIEQAEDTTLLNYNYLDMGMYFSTGITPINRYFYVPNKVMEKEARNEHTEMVDMGKVDYVVSVEEISDPNEYYDLVDKYYFDYDGLTYYLYRRNSKR